MLVCYVDDPALYYARVILRCCGEDKVLVATPDREVFRTDLVVRETYSDIKRISSTRLPGGLTENDTYLARNSGEGNFSHEELLGMVQHADRQEAPRRRIAVKLGDDGQRHPAPKTMVNRLPIEVGDLPEVWVVCFSSSKGRGVMLVQGIDAVDARHSVPALRP